MNKKQRIGVFGGSFDPIHNAHLAIARAALTEANLDRVLFVVAARPPHKKVAEAFSPAHGLPVPHATPEERYAMVAAALADQPRMIPSRLELEREGPSYTVDTLRCLQAQFPRAEWFLILGMDSLADLPNWKDPQGILDRAHLLVAPRPGTWDIPRELEGRYDVLAFHETGISSTEVRRRIAAGDRLDACLPPAVERLIREKGIYAASPERAQG